MRSHVLSASLRRLFLLGQPVKVFYCNRKVVIQAVTQLLFLAFGSFLLFLPSQYQFFIHLIHCVSFQKNGDIWFCLLPVHFLILRRSGTYSPFRYQHCERTRCAQGDLRTGEENEHSRYLIDTQMSLGRQRFETQSRLHSLVQLP